MDAELDLVRQGEDSYVCEAVFLISSPQEFQHALTDEFDLVFKFASDAVAKIIDLLSTAKDSKSSDAGGAAGRNAIAESAPTTAQTLDDILASARRSPSRSPSSVALSRSATGLAPSRKARQEKLISFKSSCGSLTGYLVTNGALISDAEVTYQPSSSVSSRGAQQQHFFAAQINEINPWILSQIQAARNVTSRISKKLKQCGDLFKMKGTTPETAARALRDIMTLVHQAQKHVDHDHPSPFPNSMCDPHVFNPLLPANVFLEFSVSHAKIDIRVYQCVPLRAKQQQGRPQVSHQNGRNLSVGDVVFKQHQYLQLTNIVTTAAKVHSFSKSFKLLNQLYNVISELHEKMTQLQFALVS